MLISPEKTTEDRRNKTVVYRTQAVAINRIVIVSEGDREECLGTIINVATFVGRRLKYGMVEIKFATKEKSGLACSQDFEKRKVNLLPLYKYRRNLCLRIGSIIPEIEMQWVEAALMPITEENPEMISVSRTSSLN